MNFEQSQVWVVSFLLGLCALSVLYGDRKTYSVLLGGALLGVIGFRWTDAFLGTSSVDVAIIFIVSLVVGVELGVLLKSTLPALALGYFLAVMIIMLDFLNAFNELYARVILVAAFAFTSFLLSLRISEYINIVSSSVGGSLLLLACVDAMFIDSLDSFGFHLLFSQILNPIKCSGLCGLGFIFFVVLASASAFLQYLQIPAEQLFEKRPRSSFYNSLFTIRSTSSDNLSNQISSLSTTDVNYVTPRDMSKELLEISEEITPVFEQLGFRFGFQSDNIRNQTENLLFSLYNSALKEGDNGIYILHQKMFFNYRKWSTYLGEPSRLSSSKSRKRARYILDLALYLLIWGESSNLRHMPECICFLFHSALRDLRSRNDTSFPPGTFLSFVVKPLYDIIKGCNGKVNYDDLNEFFWNRKCLQLPYGMPTDDGEDHTLIDELEKARKTYPEHRSHLTYTFAFWRLFKFISFSFALLTLLGFIRELEIPFKNHGIRILAGLIPFLSLIDICGEFLSFHNMQMIWSNEGMVLRSLVRYVYFMAFCTTYRMEEWKLFIIFSCIFLAPLLISFLFETFPYILSPFRRFALSFKMIRLPVQFWWPYLRSYMGNHMEESMLNVLKYQLFWVTLLAVKFYVSFSYQIMPIIPITVQLVQEKYSPLKLVFLILTMWAPFFLVFILDICIWYSVWQAICGALVGILKVRLGRVRDFTSLKRAFLRAPYMLQRCFFQQVASQPPGNGSGLGEPLLKHNFQSEPWSSFSRIWDDVIKDLRNRDLIDNEEMYMLSFRQVSGRSKRTHYLPLFLMAGCLQNAQSAVQSISESIRLGETKKSLQLSPLQLEALTELWELVWWILDRILGPRHQNPLKALKASIMTLASSGNLWIAFDFAKIKYLSKSICDLARLLRIESLKTKSKGSGMSKSMSSGSLKMLEKIERSERELVLVKGQIRNVLDAFSGIVKGSKDIQLSIRLLSVDAQGFFWDDTYAQSQLHHLIMDPMLLFVLRGILQLILLPSLDAQPKSREARRRLLFFVNSLGGSLPQIDSLKRIRSLWTLTPFYSEDVIYSTTELQAETPDGISPLLYLKTIHPEEWKSLLERLGVPLNTPRGTILMQSELQVRAWATTLGQTLYRTVRGVMLYEKALRTIGELEGIKGIDLDTLVKTKFGYVVSCQRYGEYRKSMDPKAKDIELLLEHFKGLRVAYIDVKQVQIRNESNESIEIEEFYSVLIKYENKSIAEVYRIKLPGNPIVGEGKPENQNHAVIFTRGDALQALDMNQDHYLEEAMKFPLLLERLEGNAILGFREHIFTGALSSLASYMALQEGTFVTLGQRVLNDPLRLRFHYGHPDIFDKFFVTTQGGMSKASKPINLSEDVFAGFNATLRGEKVQFAEFVQTGKGRDTGLQQLFQFEAKLAQGSAEQCISRDVFLLGRRLDFFRLLTLWSAGPGWYISNSLTVWAVFFFVYSKLLWVLFDVKLLENATGTLMIVYWFGQMGFLMTLPVLGALGVEKGFRRGLVEVILMILTGGPLFFIFNMATKWYYFGYTLLAGNAAYRATGRGFVTTHEAFSELYRFHYSSHFVPAVELGLLLGIQGHTRISLSWSLWLVVISWAFAPFWFNPMGFELDKVWTDAKDWMLWMKRNQGDSKESWRSWWQEENAYLKKISNGKRFLLAIGHLRFLLLSIGFMFKAEVSEGSKDRLGRVIWGLVLILSLFIGWIVSSSLFRLRYGRLSLVPQSCALVFALVVPWLAAVETESSSQSLWNTLLSLSFFIAFIVAVVSDLGFQGWIMREFARAFQLGIGAILIAPVLVLSLLQLPSILQTRILFRNAFDRGVVVDDILRGGKRYDQEVSKPEKEISKKSERPIPRTMTLNEYDNKLLE